MGLFGWLTNSTFIDLGLTLVVFIVIGLLVALYIFQTRLIYLPQFPPGSRSEVWKPSKFGFSPKHDEEIFLETTDGVRIHGYWLSDASAIDRNKLPTFIYFQGNAGNIGHRLPILRALHRIVPCNTFIVSYRGFGQSDGTPDEAGLKLDAQAALDYVLARPDINKNRIILYGQSIGGAVTFDLAARNQSKIYALMLENTFLSLHKLIPHVLPLLGWASSLCHQKWDSEERLREMIDAATQDKKAKFPHVLFLAGAKDELVPPSHMKQLYKMASEAKKSTVVYAKCINGNHVDTVSQREYFPAIANFLKSIL